MARKTLGTKRWKDFRISIMVRDKFLCQESLRYGKKVAAVMVHHIYPVSEYPELEFVSWNCISLSNHEHNKMHNRVNDLITRKGKIWQAKRKKEFEKFFIPPPQKIFLEWLGDRGEGAFSNHGVILVKGDKI